MVRNAKRVAMRSVVSSVSLNSGRSIVHSFLKAVLVRGSIILLQITKKFIKLARYVRTYYIVLHNYFRT